MSDWLDKWNGIIYEQGRKITPLLPDELWEKYGIKSWPKFKGACSHHVPDAWADDVRVMIEEIRAKYQDKVVFHQIKEKFCELRVYYGVDENLELSEEEMDAIWHGVDNIITKTTRRLAEKGVYPDDE